MKERTPIREVPEANSPSISVLVTVRRHVTTMLHCPLQLVCYFVLVSIVLGLPLGSFGCVSAMPSARFMTRPSPFLIFDLQLRSCYSVTLADHVLSVLRMM